MTNPVIIEAVPGTSYLDVSREFDASPEAVFHTHADPGLFVQWIGPRNLENAITQWDFRTFGSYAFEQKDADGAVYAFRGAFHTIVENQLIIQTFEYLGTPDVVSLDTIRFESLPDGRSRLVSRSVFPSREALEEMIAQGMEYGVTEGYDRLENLLKGKDAQ